MTTTESQRVVITGMGLVSPLGSTPRELLEALRAGRSGIGPLHQVPAGSLPVSNGAEARQFTGAIEDFGNLDKPLQRAIRKGQKVMCREIEMGVAAAQLALVDGQLGSDQRDPDRTGVIYGCDYIMTQPQEFTAGVRKCLDDQGKFNFQTWAQTGLPQVNPLWLLKYLPNMPASHIAIFNDLRGPNNSLTLREASALAAISEAHSTLSRGHADRLVVGATGSRILPFRALQASMQEDLAADCDDPSRMARPFAADRDGAVIGEGAAALIMETLSQARARGATILAEVVGYGSSAANVSRDSQFQRVAIANALRAAMRGAASGDAPGHIHAHGLGTVQTDSQEAHAIRDLFGSPDAAPPVVAAKSYFGNLGAGSGIMEVIASILCFEDNRLFNTLNSQTLGKDCPIRLADDQTPAGDSFVSVNVTPQGQANAVRIARFAG
jgi:3-oxoacyl-[acyl-carrier-protein] synthase II